MNNNKIAIIGLGYVGLPLAVAFGEKLSTIGFDIDKLRVTTLSNGIDVTLEVTTRELNDAKHLIFTSESETLTSCNIFIIAVPTPVDKANRPDLSHLISASRLVGSVMKPGSIVIYESTVFPGCTEEVCIPELEMSSNLRFNFDFFCGYSPERINPGDKLNNIKNIIKVTSGSTPDIAKIIDQLYKLIISAGTHLAPSIKVAEASKVIENAQRDLNIALINELSIIFERMNIDTSEVLEAAGTKWNFMKFQPGLVGGHCIGVDPYYITHKAEQLGYKPQVILAGRQINDNMSRYVARYVIKMMLKNNLSVSHFTVGILGVTFKEDCPDIRNSKVFGIIKELEDWGVVVKASDPLANRDATLKEYGVNLVDIQEIHSLNALVVAVPHNEYKSYDLQLLKNLYLTKPRIIADLKSIYDKKKLLAEEFEVFRL